jgi:hypothetical protein
MGNQKNDFHIIVLDRPVDHRRRIARSLRHRLCLDAAIAPQHRRLLSLVAHNLLGLITCRIGAASERNAPPFWSILKSERY